MPLTRWSFFVVMLCLLGGCSHTETNTADKTATENKASEPVSFSEFSAAFVPVKLPYNLPEAAASDTTRELNRKFISGLFASAASKAAFGEKDVPDLGANIEAARYYAEGRLQTDSYNAFIIHKQDEADYYYLATFTPQGKLVDVMCISFVDGAGADKTERKALIEEDLSILIRQSEGSSQPRSTGMTRMYEIGSDGSLHDLSHPS